MSTSEPTARIEVLMVEDSPTDAELAQLALQDAKVMVNMSVVEDGVEALSFLRKEGPYADAPTPDIVFLDLNLPRLDGREVLREIRSDPALTALPIVILTTSEDEEDVLRAYENHVNAFITKPVDFGQLVRVVKGIDEFWFTVVRLPGRK